MGTRCVTLVNMTEQTEITRTRRASHRASARQITAYPASRSAAMVVLPTAGLAPGVVDPGMAFVAGPTLRARLVERIARFADRRGVQLEPSGNPG